jgi:DDE superfamily endonuclease
MARHNFTTPKGKYWLGDAGYGNSEYVMVLYRGVRYHLKEQRQSNKKPENAKELFNLRHASLRNVIERIFGVVKRKFKILAFKAEYSLIHKSTWFLGFVRSITLFASMRIWMMK